MSDLEDRDPRPEPWTSALDLEARRLFASAALSAQAARRLGGRVAGNERDLLALAHRLGERVEDLERACHLRFEPSFPGVTAGPETVRGGSRLLLACTVLDEDGRPLGVAFTALIPSRPPRVSVAPAGAIIPEGWTLPEGAH